MTKPEEHDAPTQTAPVQHVELVGKPLGEIVQQLFGVDQQKVSQALLIQAEKGGSIGEILLAHKQLSPAQLAQALAAQVGFPYREQIDSESIPDELLNDLPISFAKHNRMIPFGFSPQGHVQLACCDPLRIQACDELRMLFGREIDVEVTSPELLASVINSAYDRAMRQAETAVAELEEESSSEGIVGGLDEEVVDLLDIEGDDEAPIIRLVNSLLSQASKDGASDVHIEPFEQDMLVRFRIDGVLHEIIKPPKRFQNSIVSRVKIMAGLNIAEKRLPQDGRIRLKVAGKDVDIRVSTVPTTYGERIVMRILDRSSVMRDLGSIGFSPENHKLMNKLIKSSHGIIAVTGPTGSGKTSTLYACLAKINKPDLNILTIEDPVEYQLKGVGQVQVNPKIDLTFVSGLRAFLRQDPDVIMVGEIRDKETAEIAIQASLTGHLVFSTLHTNDAPGAVTRLVDMGVEPFLVSSSLIAVVAQRLVRTICSQCKEAYEPTQEEREEVDLSPQDAPTFWRGKGCLQCQQSGYSGRIGIYELMLVNDDIRQLILKRCDSSAVKHKARQLGMNTLREDGANKVKQGLTTVEEVTRVTREEEEQAA
ncbi:MAG: type II secretion system ATPase GspE [Myxococcota bacterium]